MSRRIHLIRHGQSTFNAAYAETGIDPGHLDAVLTPLGHEQAAAARAELVSVHVDVVILSPLTRAIQTGLGIFGHRDVAFEVTCRHRERLESSCDIGRSPRELAEAFPRLRFDHLDDPWWHDGERNQDGIPYEPEDVFHRRVAHFAQWLADRPEADIAVIGHGMFFRTLTGQHFANCQVLTLTGTEALADARALVAGA